MKQPVEAPPARRPHLGLFAIVMLIVACGVIAVYSASYPKAATLAGSAASVEGEAAPVAGDALEISLAAQQTYMRKQLRWAGLGLLCLLGALWLPYPVLRSRGFAVGSLGLAVLLLLAVLFFGSDNNRACQRWLALGPITFQPSETAKFALVIFLAHCLAHQGRAIRDWRRFAALMTVVAVVAALILKEPHLGATLVVVASALAVLYAAGADTRHLGLVVAAGLVVVCLTILAKPYQRARIEAWLHPERHEETSYQALHCGTALARGGLVGRGVGRSIEKFHYLPECFTDSILAIVGEELGLLGTGGLLALFLGFAGCGLRIAKRCPDPFGRYLACGVTAVIFLQAMLNYGVTSGLLPQTGVGLPFISYGGSSLCCFLAATGLLLNVSRYAPRRQAVALGGRHE